MIQGIGRAIVRVRSYAFPLDSSFPRVRSLPPRLRLNPPQHSAPPPVHQLKGAQASEADIEDLVALRYNLQTRVVSVHTRDDAVAWDAALPYALRIHYRIQDDDEFGMPAGSPAEGRSGLNSYICLGLLESEAAQPHFILCTDTYTLSLLGRYRLLAETLARWMGTYVELVEA